MLRYFDSNGTSYYYAFENSKLQTQPAPVQTWSNTEKCVLT